MIVLAVDIGSSSVKATLLRGTRIATGPVRAAFGTVYDGDRAEVSGDAILHAIAHAIAQLGKAVKKVDVLAMSFMSPSWVAMDARGRAITPVVTHQDRRSVKQSRWLIDRFGKGKLLKTTGNMPFPGGISSTTWAWFNRHQSRLMKKADLVGHVQTFVHRHLNGSRVIDPSNASFTGLYDTLTQRGWNEALCDAVGASEHQLPQLIEAEGLAGMVSRSAGERFGVTHGTPMLVGCVDTSAAMLLCGSKPGQLLNVCGSTDVLAMCTDKPMPHENLLTRALGVGHDRWMSVSTLAAAGSALSWAKDQLYADLPVKRFFELVAQLSKDSRREAGAVSFEPYLAGERTNIEQRRAAFHGLTLATTRRQMLAAIVDALAAASAQRIKLLAQNNGRKFSRTVVTSGGVRGRLELLLHRDWPGKWRFKAETEATLRGLAVLADA